MGQRLDARSDIYAFGTILYEMLTGRRVFEAATEREWLEKHVGSLPEFPPGFANRAPAGLRGLTLNCLEKAPADRPQTWDDIIGELAYQYEKLAGHAPGLAIDGAKLAFLEVMDKAYSLTELGRGGEALTIYDQALKLNSSSQDAAWVLARKGRTLRVLGRHEEALGALDHALAIWPEFGWAWEQRAIVAERLKDNQAALRAYEQATQHRPGDQWLTFKHALLLRRLNRPADALARTESALAAEPTNYLVHGVRGDALRQLKRNDDALAAYDKALDIRPDYGDAWYGRGMTLLRRDAQGAISAFLQATRYSPNRVHPWLRLAEAYIAAERADAALPVLQQVARLRPDYRGIWRWLGLTYSKLGRYDDALTAYNTALALDPRYPSALLGRAEVLEALGRPAEAVLSYRIAAESGRPHDVYQFADALCRMKRYDAAREALETLVATHDNAGLDPAYGRLGRICERLRDPATAIEHYKRAAQLAPGSLWYRLSMVVPLLVLGRRDEALEACDQALRVIDGDEGRLGSRRPDVLIRRGAVLRALNRHTEAISTYAQVVAARPDDDRAWREQGLAYAAMGEREQALACYERAIALAPAGLERSAWAWYNKGEMLVELGQYTEAIRALNRALEINPAHKQASLKRIEARRKLNRGGQ
jgi:tetratricopeptide (TPR) repeat protein